jgi:hypothetical protein
LVACASGDQINLGSKYQSKWRYGLDLCCHTHKYVQYLHQYHDNRHWTKRVVGGDSQGASETALANIGQGLT